jgi:hypothetical protein
MNIPPYALRRHELPVTSGSARQLIGSTAFPISFQRYFQTSSREHFANEHNDDDPANNINC